MLFGLRAMGTNTARSNVDPVLFGDNLTFSDYARLKQAFEDLPMAQSVDLLLSKKIHHPALMKHIDTYGIKWYRREPQ